jgi:hypothetical protein
MSVFVWKCGIITFQYEPCVMYAKCLRDVRKHSENSLKLLRSVLPVLTVAVRMTLYVDVRPVAHGHDFDLISYSLRTPPLRVYGASF